jgi:hypothetical protein
LQRNNMIRKILFLCIVFLSVAQAQDSLAAVDTSFIPDPATVLLKSLIIPGAGQVDQERLWESVIFYGFSFTYYYQAIEAWSNYNKTSNKKYLNRFRYKISFAAMIHLLNIIDAYDAAYRQNARGWDGTMFGDKPIKSPWGATVRYLILPGWGQWYNESYIKSFLYTGLVSFVGYKVYQNNQDYKEASRKIRELQRLAEDQQDASLLGKLKSDKTNYKDNRSRYSWYFGLAYLIMLTDAHVDAYLYKFDETIKIAVPLTLQYDTPMIGLSITF